MAQAFVLDVNLRIQQVLGLDKAKQQLASIQVGGIGQTQKLSNNLKNIGINASTAAVHIAKGANVTIKMGNAAKKAGQQLKGAAVGAQGFGDQIALAGKRYAAFLGATVIAFKAFQLIGSGTKAVLDFDKAMVSLSQIIGTSVDDLAGLSQQFLELSVATGTSADEIANAAKLLAQAGFRGSQLTEAVEQLAKVPLTPIFENMEQAVDGAIAAMRQFGDEGLTVESVFDKMIKVSNNYAASFPEIIEGLKRGGSAFQAIGGTLDEFIAAFTTIRSVTRESASAVGTSLKTVASRLADPKIIKFLESKGIRLIEDDQFVGPIESIRRIGEALEKTKNVQDRINIAVKLGGRRQVSRFIALAKNFEKTTEIIDMSKNAFGEFDKIATQGLKAISVQIDIMIAKGKKLAIELGEDIFIPFIKGLTGAAEGAIALLSVLKPILPIIATISTAFVGGALFRGIGKFVGPKLAQLAGPAAFAAAGGGLKGARSGLISSPFVQAGLIVAASEVASALLGAADGADSFTGTVITSTAAMIAAITLFKNQTIAQFATAGGLFPKTLGKLGGAGALIGSLATVAAIAVPIAAFQANKSATALAEKIVESAVKSIADIEIEPSDSKSLSKGLGNLFDNISEGVQELIDNVDIQKDFKPSKFFAGIGKAVGNLLEGDFETLTSRGGLTRRNIDARVQEMIKKSPKLVEGLIQSVANSLIVDGVISTTPFIERKKLVEASLEGGKRSSVEANILTSAIIESVGGLEVWTERVRISAGVLLNETEKRSKLVKLTKNFIPNKLVGQLLQFSKAVEKTVKTINVSAKLFQTQISEIAGGISAPSLDFDFGRQQVGKMIRTGGLDDLFALTPDIPKFVGTFDEIGNLLDNFIIRISNIPTKDINIEDEVDKFFDFQKNVPQNIKDNFGDFFNIIAQDIALVSEGKFIDTEDIKQRFKKEFESLGVGATDAVVESITGFMKATFTQIEDELNRLATVRSFELDIAVRPSTQASFLREQLGRVGISAGGFGKDGPRGTVEELDLRRRERLGGDPGFGFFETPPDEFFQGRGQGLADIAGDESIRRQVREGFRKVILDSSRLKAELAGLKEGTDNFIEMAEKIKNLSRRTIEFQTVIEGLDRATQRALQTEQENLSLRQKFERADVGLRTAENVQKGFISSTRRDRTLLNLDKKHAEEQFELQDKFDAIIEKDNALRADLAKEISTNTKTQAEIIGQFDVSTRIFSDATRIQATAADLMRQNVIHFGQAVVDFTSLKSVGQTIEQAEIVGITPTQIKSGAVTVQEGLAEHLRLLLEGNTSQAEIAELMKALVEKQEQAAQDKKESPAAQKEQASNAATEDKMAQLTESMERLALIISEPSEIRFVSDQRVELDLSTLPAEVVEEVRPLLEEAGLVIAKTVARKAMESLAAKSDSEVSIAASDVARELA